MRMIRQIGWMAALIAALCVARLPAQDAVEGPRLTFVGDVCFGESYARDIAAARGRNLLEEKGYDYSLARVAPLLAGSTQVIANLETAVATPRLQVGAYAKKYRHWSDPEPAVAALKRHGLTVLALGNNHSMDQGTDGLAETLRALRTGGLAYFGAGEHATAAAVPWRTTIHQGDRERTVLVVSAFEYRELYDKGYSFYATDERAGINAWTNETARTQLQALRREHPEAFIIAFPHWGHNYVWREDREFQMGHALIDGGADLVIGHGAHQLQEIERYRDRWIIYGIGNFVMNAPGRYQHLDAPPYSLVAALDFGRADDEIALALYPIVTDNLVTDYQPRPVSAAEFAIVHELLLDRADDRPALAAALTADTDARGHLLRLPLQLPPRPIK